MRQLALWNFLVIGFIALLFSYGIPATAQTSSVELLGTISANQADNGLGFNLDPGEEWEWAAAAQAGATYARFQCSWSIVEQQTAPPTNKVAATQYVQDPTCVKAFSYAAKYKITPIVVAAFGPPYHRLLTATVPNGAPMGATSIEIAFSAGVNGATLAHLLPIYDYFCPAASANLTQIPAPVCSGFVTSHHSTQGSLVRSVTLNDATHATITLASALTVALPASTSDEYSISEVLYPSALTEIATDPSVVAYGDYVSFLASDMASRGLKGQIELWNEPPWLADPWDNRCLLYDDDLAPPCPGTVGAPSSQNEPNYGFVANLQSRSFPAGISLTWNGTSGSGWASILGPRMQAESGVLAAQPAKVVTTESFHPYGFEPEEMMWTTACLEKTAAATTTQGQNIDNCYLPGSPTTSNFSYAPRLDMVAKAINPEYGVAHEITETGILPPSAGLQMQQARFVMRQFLGFEADGVTPINFYKLFDQGALDDPNFSFVEEAGSTSSYTAKPSYTAISGFMADIKPISSLPVSSYSSATLPSVVKYSGKFPLTSVHMVGSRVDATSNSDAFMVWQRSFSTCSSSNNCGVWITQPSPSASPVTILIPASMKVTQVVNLTTRTPVSYTSSGNDITFSVADDPIEVLTDPDSSTAASTVAQPTALSVISSEANSTFGQQVTLTARLSPYKTAASSTNGEIVTFLSGGTVIGQANLTSGTATLQVSSLPAAKNTIVAQYSGDGKFTASSAFTYVTVSKANPTLILPTVESKVVGAPAFAVTPATNSSGAISVKVISGPARISQATSSVSTVVVTGAGTVVLGATQVPTANYNAASMVTTTFAVTAQPTTLQFQPISTQTYGNTPFTVSAKSASHVVPVYSVVSGPATLSGSKVTLIGAGTVVLKATQAAQGSYLASSATTSFTVNKAATTLKLSPISEKTYGDAPFSLSASSASSGVITYSVVSGPATISGKVLTITGGGTVTIKASQSASSNYSAAPTVQSSFIVVPASNTLSFTSVPEPTYGSGPITVKATSNSPQAITYKVAAGPAKIAGQEVTFTGASTVVISAIQTASASYKGKTVNLTLTVKPEVPKLVFTPVSSRTVGSASFPVAATSASPAAVTYSLVSGPGKVSGRTVTVEGAGTIVVGATQKAQGNYAAAPLTKLSIIVDK